MRFTSSEIVDVIILFYMYFVLFLGSLDVKRGWLHDFTGSTTRTEFIRLIKRFCAWSQTPEKEIYPSPEDIEEEEARISSLNFSGGIPTLVFGRLPEKHGFQEELFTARFSALGTTLITYYCIKPFQTGICK